MAAKESDGTRNEISGPARNAVQAHTIHGGVHFGTSTNEDIHITLVHPHSEVNFSAAERVLSVQIENRGTEERHLSLKVVGLAGAELSDTTVVVRPGTPIQTTVVLRRTATFPEANPWDLQVQAFDIGAGRNDRQRWVSDPKKIVIPPGPDVKPSFQQSPWTVTEGGGHETQLLIQNTGNVRLSGSVRRPDLAWLSEMLGGHPNELPQPRRGRATHSIRGRPWWRSPRPRQFGASRPGSVAQHVPSGAPGGT